MRKIGFFILVAAALMAEPVAFAATSSNGNYVVNVVVFRNHQELLQWPFTFQTKNGRVLQTIENAPTYTRIEATPELLCKRNGNTERKALKSVPLKIGYALSARTITGNMILLNFTKYEIDSVTKLIEDAQKNKCINLIPKQMKPVDGTIRVNLTTDSGSATLNNGYSIKYGSSSD